MSCIFADLMQISIMTFGKRSTPTKCYFMISGKRHISLFSGVLAVSACFLTFQSIDGFWAIVKKCIKNWRLSLMEIFLLSFIWFVIGISHGRSVVCAQTGKEENKSKVTRKLRDNCCGGVLRKVNICWQFFQINFRKPIWQWNCYFLHRAAATVATNEGVRHDLCKLNGNEVV